MTVTDWHVHAEHVLTQQSPAPLAAMPLLVPVPESTPSYDGHTSNLAADLAALTRVLLAQAAPTHVAPASVSPELDGPVSETALAYATHAHTEFVPLFQPAGPAAVGPIAEAETAQQPPAVPAVQHQPLPTRGPVAPTSDPHQATSMLSELAFLDI